MTNKTSAQIEAEAKALLEQTHSFKVPVPVETVVRRLGLKLESAMLGDDVSGVLVITEGQGFIGYNVEQPPVRQRFTIAHECGHFVLHSTTSELFIDKRYMAIFRRDRTSSTGDNNQEVQANRFAAAMLMPAELIRKEVASTDFDLGDEEAITALAEKFQVSKQAMSLRLASLGIFEDATFL